MVPKICAEMCSLYDSYTTKIKSIAIDEKITSYEKLYFSTSDNHISVIYVLAAFHRAAIKNA